MDSRKDVHVEWLTAHYQEAPANGPEAKRVKFSELKNDLETQFATSKFSSYALNHLVRETFPNTVSKPSGKSKQQYFFGLDHRAPISAPLSSGSHDLPAPATPTASSGEASGMVELLLKCSQMEDQAKQFEKECHGSMVRQADSIVQHKCTLTQGPDTIEHFHQFSLESIAADLKQQSPDLYALFLKVGDTRRNVDGDDLGVEDVKAIGSLCALLNARSNRVKGLQLMISLMLIARATSRQAITTMSHFGFCMSYTSAWSYLMKLVSEAQYTSKVQAGHWIWIYDNLNYLRRVRHERKDKHSSMQNLTSRLAIEINNVPNWDVNWYDNKAQHPRSALSYSHFMPNEDDAEYLQKCAVQYMMEFLVEHFRSLRHLSHLVPPRQSPHPVRKSTVVPMKILFRDEKYTAETIEILSQLPQDANLTGESPQVVVGDQLTCKNIRGSKRWRSSEIAGIDRLQWAHAIPGDFHFVWECLKVIYQMFWGTPSQSGSLCNVREYISRKQVDKEAKVFYVADEFLLHTFQSHLLARVCSLLGISSPLSDISHTPTLEWLQEKAKELVKQCLQPQQSDDPVYHLHRCFLHTAFLYVDLRYAIKYEDGPHVIRHWKIWLTRFLGGGRKNYSRFSACNIEKLSKAWGRGYFLAQSSLPDPGLLLSLLLPCHELSDALHALSRLEKETTTNL